MGVGRKGRAALPKAAEVCEVINPPSVPTTPTWCSIADTAPGNHSFNQSQLQASVSNQQDLAVDHLPSNMNCIASP